MARKSTSIPTRTGVGATPAGRGSAGKGSEGPGWGRGAIGSKGRPPVVIGAKARAHGQAAVGAGAATAALARPGEALAGSLAVHARSSHRGATIARRAQAARPRRTPAQRVEGCLFSLILAAFPVLPRR